MGKNKGAEGVMCREAGRDSEARSQVIIPDYERVRSILSPREIKKSAESNLKILKKYGALTR
jgi:hypothetical protein